MFPNTEIDVPFADVRDQLTDLTAPLFPIPAEAEVANNLVSMANFIPLVRDLFEALSPEVVCEIGAYRGITTNALMKLGIEYGYELHVVDPAIDAQDERAGLKRFQMLSTEYLAEDRGASVFLVDGDHNYYTVAAELALIERTTAGRPVLALMHDVSWPCARRDMYYVPDTIPEESQREWSKGFNVNVLSGEPSELGLTMEIPTAIHEGAESNGVLTAIEDFLEGREHWHYFQLPSLYGLGVLWCSEYMSSSQLEVFRKKEEQFAWLAPYAATLELNRLQLLSEMNRQGAEWKACQRAIADQKAVIDGAVEKLSRAGWVGRKIARLLRLC